MKVLKKYFIAVAAIVMGTCFTACSDANEFEDANTANPSWVDGYTDSLKIQHPESIEGTVWERTAGLKYNAYGQNVMGYVESLAFYNADSVVVKMSDVDANGNKINVDADGKAIFETATWKDESNTKKNPAYLYEYNPASGAISIISATTDSKGKVTKTTIFSAVVVTRGEGQPAVLTISHTTDTPVQTYMTQVGEKLGGITVAGKSLSNEQLNELKKNGGVVTITGYVTPPTVKVTLNNMKDVPVVVSTEGENTVYTIQGPDFTSKIVCVPVPSTEITIGVGDVKKLSDLFPSEDLSVVDVKSSDAKKAVVTADGMLNALAEGEVYVTVTPKEQSAVKTFCKVTIVKVIKTLALNHDTYTTGVGGSVQLQIVVTPTDVTPQSVTWSSSNESVARVDATGNVTTVGAGQATITATVKDELNTHTAKCTISAQIY